MRGDDAADAIEAWVEARVLDTVSSARWQQLRTGRTRQRFVDTEAVEADLAALARRYGAGDLLEVEWNAARQVLLDRIAVADAKVPAQMFDLPDVKDLHAAWTRGGLTLQDKRLVIAAVIEQITVNAGVRGRAIVGNRPDDRVVITWRDGTTGRDAAATRRPSRR